VKTQNIRLLDVFLLGPLMIYAARGARLGDLERAALAAAGVGTILYNWNNYLEKQKASACCEPCAANPGAPSPASLVGS